MKKLWRMLFSFAALMLLLPTVAYADIGPKPSVSLELIGVSQEPCYVTLLSQERSTGPYSASRDQINPQSWLVAQDTKVGLRAWMAFREYHDPDGFYFLDYFQRCLPGENFSWDYYPPGTFKVLVFIPHNDSFLVSDIQQTYAFDSNFAVRVDDLHLQVTPHYHFGWEIFSMFARIVCTILIEVLIAFLFKLNKLHVIKIIIRTNLFTQVLLNLLLNYFNYTRGSWAFMFHFLWMEIVVLLFEALVYKFSFRKHAVPGDETWLTYAATANSLSFVLGLALARIIPGIF